MAYPPGADGVAPFDLYFVDNTPLVSPVPFLPLPTELVDLTPLVSACLEEREGDALQFLDNPLISLSEENSDIALLLPIVWEKKQCKLAAKLIEKGVSPSNEHEANQLLWLCCQADPLPLRQIKTLLCENGDLDYTFEFKSALDHFLAHQGHLPALLERESFQTPGWLQKLEELSPGCFALCLNDPGKRKRIFERPSLAFIHTKTLPVLHQFALRYLKHIEIAVLFDKLDPSHHGPFLDLCFPVVRNRITTLFLDRHPDYRSQRDPFLEFINQLPTNLTLAREHPLAERGAKYHELFIQLCEQAELGRKLLPYFPEIDFKGALEKITKACSEVITLQKEMRQAQSQKEAAPTFMDQEAIRCSRWQFKTKLEALIAVVQKLSDKEGEFPSELEMNYNFFYSSFQDALQPWANKSALSDEDKLVIEIYVTALQDHVQTILKSHTIANYAQLKEVMNPPAPHLGKRGAYMLEGV